MRPNRPDVSVRYVDGSRFACLSDSSDDVAYVGWELPNHEALEAAAKVLETNGVKVESGKPNELADRRVLELAHFTCPYTGVRMELTVGNEVAFYPRFTSTRDLSGRRNHTLDNAFAVGGYRSTFRLLFVIEDVLHAEFFHALPGQRQVHPPMRSNHFRYGSGELNLPPTISIAFAQVFDAS